MLIKIRIYFPEVILGILLAVAIFAVGALFGSSNYQPANQQSRTEATQTHQPNKPDPFTWNWFTHDGVVFFTAVLGFVAFVQAGLFIWQLILIKRGMKPAEAAAKATQESTKHLPIIERAYVSGGGPYSLELQRFVLDVNNFGKTPAYLHRVEIGFCEATDIPEVPNYEPGEHSFDIFDHLPPISKKPHYRFIEVPAHYREPAIFGRFHYTDIFNSRRSAGFILSVDRRNGITQAINAPPPTQRIPKNRIAAPAGLIKARQDRGVPGLAKASDIRYRKLRLKMLDGVMHGLVVRWRGRRSKSFSSSK